MTASPADDPDALRRLLSRTEVVMLDFDGPICSVFAGIPDHVVADQLRDVLAQGEHTELPEDVRKANNPFDVFRYAGRLGDDEAHYVEAAFRAHELEAMASAAPTPHADDVMRACRESGRQLHVVSNNSAEAINAYLNTAALADLPNAVTGRFHVSPQFLKPSPFLLQLAIAKNELAPSTCVLVGDSVSDIQAAHTAGYTAIGYANKLGKAECFAPYEPEAIITSMATLAQALRTGTPVAQRQ